MDCLPSNLKNTVLDVVEMTLGLGDSYPLDSSPGGVLPFSLPFLAFKFSHEAGAALSRLAGGISMHL